MVISSSVIVFFSLLLLPTAAPAITLGQSDALASFKSQYIPIKISCIRIIKKSGRERLINNCSKCLVVQIKRTRPGRPEGALRKITIGGKQSSTLSFRGPGVTRISAEITCAEAKSQKASDPEEQPKFQPKQCLRLVKHKKAGPLMVNSCASCRKAVVERKYEDGRRKLVNLSVAANNYVPVQVQGAINARIINEKSCR
jgi:hypothetical protein